MADTKISGLAAAAAFSPSTTQEFPINDAGTSHKLSAAQLAAYFPNGTQGSSWYAQVTANQTPITALVDLTSLTVTVTVPAGRRLKITGYGILSSSVADDNASISIVEDGTTVQTASVTLRPVGNGVVCIPLVVRTPAAGTHTYKLQAARGNGTGNITLNAGASQPAFILVEDIGT